MKSVTCESELSVTHVTVRTILSKPALKSSLTWNNDIAIILNMNLQMKALYNLLRMNHAIDPGIPCEDWQIEDLRSLSNEKLFERLLKHEISLDKARFLSFAKEVDSPEQLSEVFVDDSNDLKRFDPVYLLVFELWRRFLPEKQTLSIFCDEFDFRISRYDDDDLADTDEPIQDALSNLLEILDENVDAGEKPLEIFQTISSYCAHDLMGFILDFISDLLDSGNQIYASELIEDFAYYSTDTIWFDFLRARVEAINDPIKSNQFISQLLQHEHQLTIDLLLEILRFQAGFGERPVFAEVVKKILSRMKTEDEFQELLELSADYFRRRDREDLEKIVQQLLKKRQNSSGKIFPTDPDIKKFEKLIPSK